jgi:RNA polymerase sigma factor (sigma-70 family)
MSSPREPESGGAFPQTAWTLVEQAVVAEDVIRDRALNELAAQYWQPIYIYLRRTGRTMADAEDLTQAFFVHLLEKKLLDRVRLREVRFRGFLRSVLEHFLANTARTASAKKRFARFSFDVHEAEQWLAACGQATPDAAFDSVWAMERLEAAFAGLRSELKTSGREWVADALLERIGMASPEPVSVRELAARHGVSDNQLSVAMHRARERLKALLIADLCSDRATPEEAAEELAAMFAALGKRPG